MARHYVVQPFTKKGRGLVSEPSRPAKTPDDARDLAGRLADRYAGVMAYEIDVEGDDVGDPRVLARYGAVPDLD